MSTATLLVEAVDTAIALGRAVIGWLIFLAVTASILALAAVACGAWAVNTAWGALYGRWRGAEGPEVESEPQPSAKPTDGRTGRRVPKWAHTQPINHEWDEAA